MKTSRWRNFRLSEFFLSYGFVVAVVLVIVIFSIGSPRFLTGKNILFILHSSAPMMILATGVALVLMTGKIDISVGSIAYLSAAVGVALMDQFNLASPIVIVLVMLTGALLGTINAVMVVILRINPLITTLGTLFTFRGLALEITGGTTLTPGILGDYGNVAIGPIFIDVIIAALILVIFHLVHRRTPFGRHVMAIGNGAEIAQKLGIPVDRVSFMTFVLSGLMASIGGLFTLFQTAALDETMGQGYEFTAIALLIIGGVSLFGGEGTILPGVAFGALTLTIIENGLNILGASVYVYPIVRGVIIFVAMYADSLKNRRTRRSKPVLAEEVDVST